MGDYKHLDLEKVGGQQLNELLRTARLQGQWTAAKSLQRQAELLKVKGPIMQQFEVHIKRVEERLGQPLKQSKGDK